MGRIHLLDEAVIHRIAAGEVVQRPASALKELVENSLDAGADFLTIRLEKMGRKLVEVEDNGMGMTRNDALMSIERHATSKINEAEDLLQVETLGFRGEALPSIAAVSRMVLRTKCPGDTAGTELVLNGGKLLDVRECGMSDGTVVSVRNLFFNTPARRRFLKSDRTEGYHLYRTLYALSFIHTGARYEIIQDGRKVLTLAAVSSLSDRAAQIFRGKTDGGMVSVDARDGGAHLWGEIAVPPFAQARGRGVFLFLNRRWIADRKILRAVFSAYQSVTPRGFVPDAVLFLDVPPHLVDINVHPSKQEVRLSMERHILPWIKSVLAEHLSVSPDPVQRAVPDRFPERMLSGGVSDGKFAAKSFDFRASGPKSPIADPGVIAEAMEIAYGGLKKQEEPSRAIFSKGIPDGYRVLGIIVNTYIVCAYEDGLFIVDKHAAHERLIFERLKRAYPAGIASQKCLFPLLIPIDEGELDIITAAQPGLNKLGIILEPFGEGTLRVAALPEWVPQGEAESLVREIIRELGESPLMDQLAARVDKFLATIACHSAVRGQDALSAEEAYGLLDQLVRESVPLACPHGRPYIHFLSLKELEKIFDR